MNREDFPAPREAVIVTHFLVMRDQDTSREWYQSVFGAEVVNERDPVIASLSALHARKPGADGQS